MFLNKEFKYLISVVVLALSVVNPIEAHGDSFFSNTIDKSPDFSKELSVYLLDLSGSVDGEIVSAGLESVRTNIANVYVASDAEKGIPASSYYQWIPIRGSEANSLSLLFSPRRMMLLSGRLFEQLKERVTSYWF